MSHPEHPSRCVFARRHRAPHITPMARPLLHHGSWGRERSMYLGELSRAGEASKSPAANARMDDARGPDTRSEKANLKSAAAPWISGSDESVSCPSKTTLGPIEASRLVSRSSMRRPADTPTDVDAILKSPGVGWLTKASAISQRPVTASSQRSSAKSAKAVTPPPAYTGPPPKRSDPPTPS